MNKLRTIIRLYEEQTGLKTIAVMARTSRNTVKKYIDKWNSLYMSYEDIRQRSDAELHDLFCVPIPSEDPNPRMEELEGLMPDICKQSGRKGYKISLKPSPDLLKSLRRQPISRKMRISVEKIIINESVTSKHKV
jgi:hypothetical protein